MRSLAKEVYTISLAPQAFDDEHINRIVAEVNDLSGFERALMKEAIGDLVLAVGYDKIGRLIGCED